MATFNKPIATNQGIALLKAEVAGTDSITFTKTVFSSDDYSQTADSDIANLTAIQSMDLTTTAQTFQDVNGNTKVRAIGYNNSVNQAFYIKTYALYAKNKAGNEILFAVASSQTADFVPAFNNAQLTQISYTFTFAIDQTSNITLSDQHEITVTQADIATINNAVNSNASSLTAQQSSYASSLNSAFSSNNSSMNSAFSANSSNASSYVSSTANSLTSYVSSNVGSMQSQVNSNASNINSNAAALTSLSNASITYQGKISNFNQGSKQGLYKYFDGTTSSTLTVVQYNDVIIQTRVDTWDANGAAFSDDDYAPKMRLSADGGNTWSAWSELATQYDVQAIDSTATSLASSLAVQNSAISSNISSNATSLSNQISNVSSSASVGMSNNANNISSLQSSVANNSSAIASNSSNLATQISNANNSINANSSNISNLQSSVAANSSAIASNATSLSNAVNSVSSSNSAVNSSVASAISNAQSSVANNATNISNLQSAASTSLKYFGTVNLGNQNGNLGLSQSMLSINKDGYWFVQFTNGNNGMSGQGLIIRLSNINDAINSNSYYPDNLFQYVDTINNRIWQYCNFNNYQSSSSQGTSSWTMNANSNDISQLTATISSMQTTIANLPSSYVPYRGLWQGRHYWDLNGQPDGIYSIDVHMQPRDFGLPSGFSGYGTLTLTTNWTGGDRYLVIHDNNNNMFRNHQNTSNGSASGWTAY